MDDAAMSTGDSSRLEELEGLVAGLVERVAGLEDENQQLRSGAALDGTVLAAGNTRDQEGRWSRRGLLLGGAGVVAVGAVALVGSATPAVANSQGQSLTLGDPSNTATATTGVQGTYNDRAVFQVNNGGTAAAIYGVYGGPGSGRSRNAAVVGDTQGGDGVAGLSANGNGVYGAGLTGVYGAGNDTGVYGSGLTYGAYGAGNLTGVYGTGDLGVHGDGSTTGVSGNGDTGVYGSGNTGLHGSGTTIGVYGSGQSGVLGQSAGGDAVVGQVTSPTSTGNAIHGAMAGKGVAGRFEITNTANATAALYGVTSGTGQGVKGNSTGALGVGVTGTSTNGLGGQFGGKRAALNLIPASTVGKPTSGAHSRGDIVIDSVGALFLCTVSGTPGTWVKVTVTAA